MKRTYRGRLLAGVSTLILAGVFVAAAPQSSLADVIYTFYDANITTQIDLSFQVDTQLATKGQEEPMTNIGGVYASDFAGQSAEYFQGPPGYQPVIETNGLTYLSASFTGPSFPYGDAGNGAPGNGNFPVSGAIAGLSLPLAFIAEGTVSGVPTPVPEPGSLALLATGLVGLIGGTAVWRRRRRAGSGSERGGRAA